MHPRQIEMLSVKSTIERTLSGYAASHLSDLDVTPQQRVNNYFNNVERYVAMLFVSGQIDNNYIVRSTDKGVEVRFSTRGQCSFVHYFLPDDLRWTVRKMIPRKTEIETISYQELYTSDTSGVTYIEGPDPVIDTEPGFEVFESAHNGREDKRGHLTAAEEDALKALKTIVFDDAEWTILHEEVNNIKS